MNTLARMNGMLRIYDGDETRTEGSILFGLVIGFTIFGPTRPMQSFTEGLPS